MPKVKTQGSPERTAVEATNRPDAAPELTTAKPGDSGRMLRLAVACSLAVATFVWAYWPTLVELVSAWEREPDYSHGYLVLPFAILFCWLRRDTMPALAAGFAWGGLLLVAISLAIRVTGALAFIGPMDAWSILFWVGGVAWFLLGRAVFFWALPAIGFLAFMIPLPYQVERWLRLPLQRVATEVSSWTLQLLGQPAVAQGNTILMGRHELEVEDACSGLRIFVAICALAYAYMVMVRCTWWKKLVLAVAIVPIALTANATRIIVTGLLHQLVSSDWAHKFTHDIAGWAMIPYAALLFGLVLWLLGHLVVEHDAQIMKDLVRAERR